MHDVLVFVGTRPEAIKMAPVVSALRQTDGLRPIVVSTGQHREMLRQVIDLFGIHVDHDLDLMTPDQTLAGLSSRLIEGIDRLLGEVRPSMTLVQGDTTTVLMATLASFYRNIPVGHVEAGLRTGDIRSPFPEEANRKLASPLVTLHFPPTERARENLLREGVDDAAITVTGNTVIDALMMEVRRQEGAGARGQVHAALADVIGQGWPERPSILVTGHRRENFGPGFDQICDALSQLAQRFPDHLIIYPVHLNPNVKGPVTRRLEASENVVLIPPQDYASFVALMHQSRLILTDSGGVQEEAPSLGKPVLVMRDTTERPEGVAAGTVLMTGPHAQRIVEAASHLLEDRAAYEAMSRAINPYGDGRAAGRVADRIRAHLG